MKKKKQCSQCSLFDLISLWFIALGSAYSFHSSHDKTNHQQKKIQQLYMYFTYTHTTLKNKQTNTMKTLPKSFLFFAFAANPTRFEFEFEVCEV